MGNATTNTGCIYFDFNEAIITNTTSPVIRYPIILKDHKPLEFPALNTVVIYPNPAESIITINIPALYRKDNLTMKLYDARGFLVKSEKLQAAEQQISIGNLASGIYFGKLVNQRNELAGSFRVIGK